MPLKFLGESIQTACYLINRLPTPLLSHKSPYELLHTTPPIYTHLRVFGCLSYVTNLTPVNKFDVRARRCVFLGYPIGQKGYKLYDLTTHKFLISRDVIFHEHIFPYTSPTQATQPVLPLVYPSTTSTLDPFLTDFSSPHNTDPSDPISLPLKTTTPDTTITDTTPETTFPSTIITPSPEPALTN